MIRFFTEITQAKLFRDLSWITVFQILSKLLSLLASAWAVRCLGPSHLGISGMVVSWSMLVVLLITFNQEVFLIRNYKRFKESGELKDIIDGVFTFQTFNYLLLAFCVGLFLFFFGVSPEYYLSLVSGFALFFLMSTVPKWILQAQEQVPVIYFGNVIFAVVQCILIFVFFTPGMVAGADVVVYAVGTLCSYVFQWYVVAKKIGLPALRWSQYRRALRICFDSRWIFVIALLGILQRSLGGPLIGYFNTLEELGLYRTIQILEASLGTFISALPWLIYPKFVHWQNELRKEEFWTRQCKIAQFVGVCVLVCCLALFLLAPTFYPLVFGEEFAEASMPFAMILSARLIQLVGSLFTIGLWSRAEDKLSLQIIGPVAVISFLMYGLLIPGMGMMGFAWVALISETVILLLVFGISWRKYGMRARR